MATGQKVAPAPKQGRDLLRGALLCVLMVLAAFGDDRHVGQIADGRQMIRTAVALVETGGIGQSAGRDFTFERPEGDAVSRFGMGTSLLQVPAAWLAPRIEAWRGAGSSQALFLMVPWLAIGIAAAAAGAMTRRLGGGDIEVAAAVLLSSLASPLGSYAFLEFSEPVQAAALALALSTSLAAALSPVEHVGRAFAAGLAAGFAVLSKSSLLVAAPFTLLPLVNLSDLSRTKREFSRAAAGAAVPIVIWIYFEMERFGELFGGYPDDRFTHFWLDGLWRLVLGPNRGLILFWPALPLFIAAGFHWRSRWFQSAPGRAWAGAGLVMSAQFAIASGYWGWHGMEGWGPRLVVAAIPLMAPFAVMVPGPGRRASLVVLVALSSLLNLPPLLQHPTPVASYVTNLKWPEIAQADVDRFPFYARSETPSGRATVVPFEEVERVPAANPWRLYLWFFRTSHLDSTALATALSSPPWRESRPDLVPAATWTPEIARHLAPEPRVGFLGRSLTGGGGPYATVYLDALLDQVVRAHQQNQIDLALDLSERRLELRADGEAAAWRLESLRRARRPEDAFALLRSLPEASRVEPLVNVALALFDRDGGEEPRARALLRSVAAAFPRSPLQAAIGAPLDAWPATLDLMTRSPRRDATVAGPR